MGGVDENGEFVEEGGRVILNIIEKKEWHKGGNSKNGNNAEESEKGETSENREWAEGREEWEAAGRVWRPPVVGGSPRRGKLLSHFQLEMKKKLTTKSEGGDENMCENFLGRKKNKNRTNIGFVQFQVLDHLLLGE